MTEVEIVVDNVAKTGTGIVKEDKWYNFPKGSSKKFDGVAKGDTVILALDEDGKVTEFKVKAKAEAKKPFTGGGKGGFSRPVTPENARQTAVNAVLGAMNGGDDLSQHWDEAMEAMKKVEKYIMTGNF